MRNPTGIAQQHNASVSDHGSFYAQTTPAAGAESGRALHESNCVYCHGSDPVRLRTPPKQIPELSPDDAVDCIILGMLG